MSIAPRATDEPKAADDAGMPDKPEGATPELSDAQLDKCIGGLGDILRQRPDLLV